MVGVVASVVVPAAQWSGTTAPRPFTAHGDRWYEPMSVQWLTDADQLPARPTLTACGQEEMLLGVLKS
ncbi:MAG: hypothetical protein ABI249_00195 [Ornithinibacter sp.]